MQVDRAVAHIITGYSGAIHDVRARVSTFVRGTWNGLEQFRDADIERFVGRVIPMVNGGQIRIAALTDAYLAAVEQSTLGAHVRPRGIPAKLVTTEALRGVPAEIVYRRPAVTVYTALSKGFPLDQAAKKGLDRALSISATDLQLARTHTMRFVASQNDRIVGYRRTIESGNPCELCLTASTQRYHGEDLMPIHNGCGCGVEPIFGTEDPGQVIDPDLLDSLTNDPSTEDAGATVAVHDHGELGPVLTVAGQNFKTADDLDS